MIMLRRHKWIYWALFAALAAFSGRAEAQSEFEFPKITPGPNMTLFEALRAADKRNVTLSSARIEIEKAEAQLSQAWGLVLPTAQASMQLMYRDHEDTINFAESMPESMQGMVGSSDLVIMPQEDLKGSLQAGMALVNAQNWYTISAAKKGVELARMSIEQARQQILLGVAQAYYMSLMAKSLIEMYEEELKSSEHHLEVAMARFDAGTGLRIDVIRAETDMEQARQQLLGSHLAFDNARDAIGVLTGVEGLPMPVEAKPIDIPPGSDDELSKKAIQDRPDIKVKRSAVGLLETQLDAAWMQFVPTLQAGWQLDYQFTKPGDMGSDDRSRWAAVLTLTVPLYNHFRYGDLDHKRASLRQAIIQQEEAEQNATMAVRKARRDYLTALSSVTIAERQEKLAKEALLLSEASYDAGTGSSLDVTDSRRRASEALINLAAKRLEAQIALLTLISAVGEDILEISK
jgi:outer membrane protein TolC